jgi:uncharacterized protein (DUF2141 family)
MRIVPPPSSRARNKHEFEKVDCPVPFLHASGVRSLLPLTALLIGAAESAMVEVTVTGLRSAKGDVSICVMADKSSFPACATGGLRQRVAINGTTARAQFGGIKAGVYAVTAFHDEDGDGKLKTNFIGMPKEGVGVSGKVGGIPSFSKSSISVGPGTKITLATRYL